MVRNILSPYTYVLSGLQNNNKSRIWRSVFLLTKHNRGWLGLVYYICRFIKSKREKEALLDTCHSLVFSISCLSCLASFNSFIGQRVIWFSLLLFKQHIWSYFFVSVGLFLFFNHERNFERCFCCLCFFLWCTSYRECNYTPGCQGNWERIQGPVKKKSPLSLLSPGRAVGLKIFALNRKNWLSVAERLWLGLKGLICTMYK